MRIKQSEADVKKACCDYLDVLGIAWFRRNVGAARMTGGYWVKFAATGQSDLWAIWQHGTHMEIELKATGKKPTEDQKKWLAACRERGAIAFWADSLDMMIMELRAAAAYRGWRVRAFEQL